jgi:hypothetical protein
VCTSAESKLISWVKPPYFDFSSSNFTVQDHRLSTAGDGLMAYTTHIKRYTSIMSIHDKLIYN